MVPLPSLTNVSSFAKVSKGDAGTGRAHITIAANATNRIQYLFILLSFRLDRGRSLPALEMNIQTPALDRRITL
jgi:hypothetical protein